MVTLVVRTQHAIIALGAVSLVAAALLEWRVPAPVPLGAYTWLAGIGFTVLLYLLQQQGFVLRWRGESTKISLDELGIFGALLVLSPVVVIACVVGASLANQLAHRRAPLKAAFNVAQYALAAVVATGAAEALRFAGVPAPWFAAPAPILFSAITAYLVSLLFARLEGTSARRVFVERFGRIVVASAALGLSLGLIVYALWQVHPLAVLAAVPVFAYLRRFGRLSEWADDELATHRLVAGVSAEVAGRADLDDVAERILRTCQQLFDSASATLTLAIDPSAPPRVWEQRAGESAGTGGVSADILGADGARIGSIDVFPRPGQARFGERELQLLRAVAASATAAAANAHALRVASAARERQRETIKRLENMNRELEEFTLWTTHDMREPLRSIGTIADFLHEDIGRISPDEARDMARRICEGADRLKERVKALHAFSLIVQRDDEFQDVDMQRVVEGVVTSLEAKVREKGATVVLPREALPSVRAQPHRIDQVFANLVENALKYGCLGEMPRIEIGVVEGPNEWRFYVRDDGPGLPPGYHDRVFQLFQRGPDPREGGSGAGLAIVKRIAEQHGGRAWVESRTGEGACFFVSLPKRAGAPPEEPLVTVRKSF